MQVAPETVQNVWAGDAVRFVAPLGNFRRPGVAAYSLVTAFCITAGVFVAFAPSGAEDSGLLVLAACVLGVVVIADLLAWGNRWLARRIVRRTAPVTLGVLATHCWLRALIRGTRGVSFDAGEWLRRTGAGGPRVVIREVDLKPTVVDGAVNEEELIDASTERRKPKRRGLWCLMAIYATLAWFQIRSGFRVGSPLQALIPMAVFTSCILYWLWKLGYFGLTLSTLSVYPGVLCRRRPQGVEEYTRQDSVLVIEPIGTTDVLRVTMIRRDDAFVPMEFSLGANDPMLARLLARWCWRDGAGKLWENHPTRDAERIEADPSSLATSSRVMAPELEIPT